MGWWRDPHRPIIRTIGEKWKGGSYQIFFFAAYFSGVGWKRRHTSTSVRDIREGRVRSPDRSIVHELIGAADFRVLYTLSAPSERKKKKNLLFFFFSSQNSFFFQSPSSSFIAAIFPVRILKEKKKNTTLPIFAYAKGNTSMAEEGKLSLKKKNGNREDPWYVVVRRLMIHWSKGRGVRCRKQTLSDREQDKQNVKEPTSCYTYPENGNTNTATTVPPIHYCPLNPPKTEETTLDCLQVSRNTRGQNDEKNRGDNKIHEKEIQWKTVGYAIRSNWMKKKRSKSISRNRIVCFENPRYMKNKPKDLPRSATYDAAKGVH